MEYVYPLYEKDDIEKVRKALAKGREKERERNCLLFEIGIYTALRCSDLISITRRDIERGYINNRSKKKNKEFNFKLPEDLKERTLKYCNDKGIKVDDLIFPISRFTVNRVIKDAAKQAGVKERIGSHSIRKTRAYHFFEETQDLTLTMQLLQHDNTKSTLSYIGKSKKELEEAVEKYRV